MAAQDQPDFDEFETVESTDDSSTGWIDLGPGEVHTGEITAYRPYAGDYGIIEIDGRPYSLNQTQRDSLVAALVVGKQVGLRCSNEEESFEDSDGEEVTYYPTQIGFKEADD